MVGAPALGFVLLIALIAGSGDDEMAGITGGGGGILNPAAVPAAFAPWLQKAGSLCPQVSAPLLAAQVAQESGFNTAAVSRAGAQGPSQFMPGTWPSWGRDDDGNGVISPNDIGDAVMAQGRFMCALTAQMSTALDGKRVTGTLQDLALAAYNAGPGGVLAAGGVPRNGETDGYVTRINAALMKYGTAATPGSPGGAVLAGDGGFAANLVGAARRWVGKPYVWGGGDINGPTGGGFDCSGLTLNAVYAASGGAIKLPHSAATQSKMGSPVPLTQIRAGDLLFFADTPSAPPHHVGIALGGSQMLDAPDFGKTVSVADLSRPYYRTQTITARRFG